MLSAARKCATKAGANEDKRTDLSESTIIKGAVIDLRSEIPREDSHYGKSIVKQSITTTPMASTHSLALVGMQPNQIDASCHPQSAWHCTLLALPATPLSCARGVNVKIVLLQDELFKP